MKIWNLPIEPLEERYSTQWAKWWALGFTGYGVENETITGSALTSSIETGSFLDCHSTVHWKLTQLATLVAKIKKGDVSDGDVIFFHDLWFPGIEGLGYIKDISGAKFRIAGYFHAGSYDPNDLLAKVNMQRWVSGIESGWLELIDTVFVGSEYHKTMLINNRKADERKIYAIGYPVHKNDVAPFVTSEKENIVVFPHRLDNEKNPDIFDYVAEKLKGVATFIKTKEVCKTKEEYYAMLAKAKVSVSFASQETFGIAMVESALAGCVPITPNKLSYLDTMPSEWRFDSIEYAVELIKKALTTKHYEYHKETNYSVKTITGKVLQCLYL